MAGFHGQTLDLFLLDSQETFYLLFMNPSKFPGGIKKTLVWDKFSMNNNPLICFFFFFDGRNMLGRRVKWVERKVYPWLSLMDSTPSGLMEIRVKISRLKFSFFFALYSTR